MITGMILSPSFCVFALNCLQNSMMFTPCCPHDGPTGGAGLALPAGICSLICADTSLAILTPLRDQLSAFSHQQLTANRCALHRFVKSVPPAKIPTRPAWTGQKCSQRPSRDYGRHPLHPPPH